MVELQAFHIKLIGKKLFLYTIFHQIVTNALLD